jgi:hypothetical protein
VLEFNDVVVEKIFGKEAAEDEAADRLKEYFFRNKAYENVVLDLPIRILVGHKGIGKSALLKVSYLEDLESGVPALWLRPGEVKSLITSNTESLIRLIEQWKAGLSSLITSEAFEHLTGVPAPASTAVAPRSRVLDVVSDMLRCASIPAHRASLAATFSQKRQLRIYLDDLDRGWEGQLRDIRGISALLNCLRDLTNDNPGLQFRLGLRSDVYFLVRTSDESTDKIEASVIWLSWTNHEILTLMAKRVETYFGNSVDETSLVEKRQDVIALHLHKVMTDVFRGRGKWEKVPIHRFLLSLTRQRPRDLVKLCHGGAKAAFRRRGAIVETGDFQSILENYSQERLQDIVNEFRTELPNIESLLFGMKPSRPERTTATSYQYTNDQLITKIHNICGQNAKFVFANNRVASPRELAQFMYKIDFITARKVLSDETIDRKYFDQSRYLQNQFTEFGYDWEIHPAYRWALQPGNLQEIFDKLQLDAEESGGAFSGTPSPRRATGSVGKPKRSRILPSLKG